MQTQENELKDALNQDEVNAVNQEADTASEALENAEAVEAAEGSSEGLSELEALKQQLNAVQEQSAREKDELLRAVAEAQNGRRRAEADVEKERKYGIEKFVKALIPVVDSLDMALSMGNREEPAAKATLDGVENTLNLFLKELKAFGVERLNPVGEPFNPNFHQAISMAPSNDVKPNHVLSVMQKGFVLNGRVVRPAMVIVAKALETEGAGVNTTV